MIHEVMEELAKGREMQANREWNYTGSECYKCHGPVGGVPCTTSNWPCLTAVPYRERNVYRDEETALEYMVLSQREVDTTFVRRFVEGPGRVGAYSVSYIDRHACIRSSTDFAIL